MFQVDIEPKEQFKSTYKNASLFETANKKYKNIRKKETSQFSENWLKPTYLCETNADNVLAKTA
jgi:hypothetical protein